jgi:hypothetical protein
MTEVSTLSSGAGFVLALPDLCCVTLGEALYFFELLKVPQPLRSKIIISIC